MKVIVLAAGKGTRLLPVTSTRPKHLLEIAGSPILKRIIDQLIFRESISEIVVITHYFESLIQTEVRSWYNSSVNSKINFIHQKEMIGTANALLTAFEEIQKPSGHFMVIYGDLIVHNHINLMLDEFANNSQSSILGVKVDDASKFGVLKIDDGYLSEIDEKPTEVANNSIINAGIFIFPAFAVELLSSIEPSSRGEYDLTDLVSLLARKNHFLHVTECHEGWFDIGHPWQIIDANEYLMKIEQQNYLVQGTIEDGTFIKGNVYVAKTATIRSGTYIEGPVYIDEEADVGPNCYIRSYSYIGKKVRIGNACEIKNSIIYENTHAAHLSYVGDSIFGKNCNLGAGTIVANLRHDSKNIKVTINDERMDSGRRKLGVIAGDDVKTGIGVSILPGVKLASGTWINSGEVVSRDR